MAAARCRFRPKARAPNALREASFAPDDFFTGAPCVVSRRVRGRHRMGRTAKRIRHVAIRRRRHDGLEALYRQRQIDPAHVELLCRTPLRHRAKQPSKSLPFHQVILGLPAAPRDRAHKEPAQRHASAQSKTRLTPEQKTAIGEQAKQVRTSCESGART